LYYFQPKFLFTIVRNDCIEFEKDCLQFVGINPDIFPSVVQAIRMLSTPNTKVIYERQMWSYRRLKNQRQDWKIKFRNRKFKS